MIKKYLWITPLALLLTFLLVIDYSQTDSSQSTRYTHEKPFNILRMAPTIGGSLIVKYTVGDHDLQANLSAVKYKVDTCQEYGIQLSGYPTPKSDINTWGKFKALIGYKVFEYSLIPDKEYQYRVASEQNWVSDAKLSNDVRPVFDTFKIGGILGGPGLCKRLSATMDVLLPVEPLGGRYKFSDDSSIKKTTTQFKSSMYYTKLDVTKTRELLKKRAYLESENQPGLSSQERNLKRLALYKSYSSVLMKESGYFYGFLITKYKGRDHNSLIVVRDKDGNYLSYSGLHDDFKIVTNKPN